MNCFSSFLLSTLFTFLAFGASAQTRIDTFVELDRHRLHFTIIEGRGTPILFEAGNGDSGAVWEPMLEAIHAATGATLITYDRAGLGQSGIDTASVSFQQEIKDLERTLEILGYDDDLFLVNHSFGAFYNTLFARKNRRKIKGAVYIDPALPCFFTESWSESYVASFPPETWAMLKEHRLGLYYVLRDLPGITAKMSKKSVPKKIPLTVIVAENILPMVKAEEKAHWRNCLRSFAAERGYKYVFATGAEHKVWERQADLVVREIAELYRKIE